MTFHGTHNEQYLTGREIGRGGEGTVFELQHDNGKVLKRYNEPLTPAQINKLKQMVAMRNPAIEAYAAWPTDLVTDDRGVVCGFIMKKLVGYVPLHMIFSPMDRKKMFPDKGYNFLVHVARNLATAFHKLHEAGLVVGDVNEGNILISSSGLVSFIDCDSFQVKSDTGYYFCEVGVPRYTPPELLSLGSFDKVVRTTNTDSFSLAVLIFQLLFLGRHPFAGKNRSAIDIDEETAIKQHEFAYSLESKRKKLLPPKDSFPITAVSDELSNYFHLSFEQDIRRPLPADWVKALDAFLLEMVSCSAFKLHSYPSKLNECPWCAFRKASGIMYFLDDSYLQANSVLSDIDNFVNGFKTEKLELKKWAGNLSYPQLTATPIAQQLQTHKRVTLLMSIGFFIAGVIASFVYPLLGIAGIILAYITIKYAPPAKKIKAERSRLTAERSRLALHLEKLISEYNNPSDIAVYTAGLKKLEQVVHEFRRLPDEHSKLQKLMEESIYNQQLHDYLRLFDIQSHEIPSIGPGKKTQLLNGGIRNAADISLLSNTKISGIGPKNQQVLLSWQRQMASGFVYIPDTHKIAIGMQQVNHDVAGIKLKLESQIRKEYQSLNYMKQNITNRSMVLENQINDIAMRAQQADLDEAAFNRFSRFI